MPSFYRGSTPTIRLKLLGGLKVTDLGDCHVAITQDLVFYGVEGDDLKVDTASNTVSFTLPYDESMRFVPGVPTQIQQVWQADDGTTVVFPPHNVDVFDTIVQVEDDVDVEEEAEDQFTVLDDDWGL